LLGTTWVWPPLAPRIYIANMFAQEFYGREKRHLNYEHLYNCLVDFHDEHVKNCGQRNIILFPKYMGCGLAGGNWNIVLTMIKEVFADRASKFLIVEKE
jgi:hypothetical protein